MKKNFFGDIKEKIKKANDTADEEYYNEDEYEEEDDDGYGYNESESTPSTEYSPSLDYDFGGYESSSSYVKPTPAQKEYKPSSASSGKFTKKQGTNIYQMNNTASEVKVRRVVYFVLEDAEDARNIADCMIKKDAVVLADITRLSKEDANRVLNFLDGVRYIYKSSIENISNIHLIVPDSIELTGDFFEQVSSGAFFN